MSRFDSENATGKRTYLELLGAFLVPLNLLQQLRRGRAALLLGRAGRRAEVKLAENRPAIAVAAGVAAPSRRRRRAVVVVVAAATVLRSPNRCLFALLQLALALLGVILALALAGNSVGAALCALGAAVFTSTA